MRPALPPLDASPLELPELAGPAALARALEALGGPRATPERAEALAADTGPDPGQAAPAAAHEDAAGLALAGLRAGAHVTLHGTSPDPELLEAAREAGLLVRGEATRDRVHAALEAGHPCLLLEAGGWTLALTDVESEGPWDAVLELAEGVTLKR